MSNTTFVTYLDDFSGFEEIYRQDFILSHTKVRLQSLAHSFSNQTASIFFMHNKSAAMLQIKWFVHDQKSFDMFSAERCLEVQPSKIHSKFSAVFR